MDPPSGQALSLPRFLRLMLWTQARTLAGRIRAVREESRLLLTVLTVFVLGYLVVGYLLFYYGLAYINNFPIIGTLLSQRIVYLIFGFFFVMLVFSNVITNYTTLFRNRETAWFLTLPIPHKHIYLWKFLESLLVSSWALVFLSAPMMAAYGRVHQVSPVFYFQMAAGYLPFVVLPSVLGSWLILILIRALSRRWVKRALVVTSLVLILALALGISPTSETEAVSTEDIVSFEKLLRHTRISLSPGLPSSWLARSVVASSQNLGREASFYFLLLCSYALFGMFLSYEVASRFFYSSWSHTEGARTLRARRRSIRRRQPAAPASHDSLLERLAAALPFASRPMKALIVKDFRVFWRDPAQWTQFAIFFGLLCIYVLNLRNIAYDFNNEFWSTIISYLNLGACALTLSTLTTRFVFPQFSLEGRRLWIIGLAPVGIRRILLLKFWSSWLGAAAITMSLMVASSLTLQLEVRKVAFFALAIMLMSATLSGLAVGLGALFPNLKEENPSKIVSGFGGTLCLVVSFIYITVFIGLLAFPASLPYSQPQLLPRFGPAIWLLSCLAALVVSLLVLLVPMVVALRRLKNLEF